MSRANFDKTSLQSEVLRCVVERGVVRMEELRELPSVKKMGDRVKLGVAIRSLSQLGYVIRGVGDDVEATRQGKRVCADMAAQDLNGQSSRYVGELAAPRVVFARSPEVLKLSTRPGPIRPGADDWRAIPSRMGDTLRLPTGEVIQG